MVFTLICLNNLIIMNNLQLCKYKVYNNNHFIIINNNTMIKYYNYIRIKYGGSNIYLALIICT